MPRYFTPISIEELKGKVEAAKAKVLSHASWGGDYFSNYSWKRLTPTIAKDLSKVHFDLENVSNDEHPNFGPKDLVGYSILPNGLSILGICAGGDWESPIFFVIYYDGRKLRAYIPSNGNPWNKDTGAAFGNDDEADRKYAFKVLGHDEWEVLNFIDGELLADIQERIIRR